jgi:hypothetical protein
MFSARVPHRVSAKSVHLKCILFVRFHRFSLWGTCIVLGSVFLPITPIPPHSPCFIVSNVVYITSVSNATADRQLSSRNTDVPSATTLWGGAVSVDRVWNVMAHTQKPDFVFRRNGRVHLNRRERQPSRPLAAEVCASTVVMLDTPCSEVVWRVLVTHSIRQLPLHFPSRASPCAITFKLDSTTSIRVFLELTRGRPIWSHSSWSV